MQKESVYRLKAFEECPLKFKHTYIDNLGDRYFRPSKHLLVGKAVHSALAGFFRMPPSKRERGFLHQLLRNAWAKDKTRRQVFESRQEEAQWGKETLAKLDAYFERTNLQAQPVLVEKNLEWQILPDLILKGRVDRVDLREDGTFEVIDYKTGKFPTSNQYLRRDLQLPFYKLLVEGAWGGEVNQVSLEYLGPDPPWTMGLGDELAQKTRERILDLVEAIRVETEYPPRYSSFCRWCDYNPICPEYSYRHGLAGGSQSEEKV